MFTFASRNMYKHLKIIIIVFLSIILFNNCFFYEKKLDKDNFYEFSMLQYDLWRLPIVYPYQLTSAYCCEDWTFGAYSQYGHVFDFSVSPDSVNFENDHIILHHPYSNGLLPWLVFNINTKEKYQFEDYKSICKFRLEHSISDTMYSCEEVYYNWRDKGELSWK